MKPKVEPKAEEFQLLLTVNQVAKALQISPRTIQNQTGRKATKRFPIPVVRIGKSVRFRVEDVREYVRSLD